jgi:hypothetical protein
MEDDIRAAQTPYYNTHQDRNGHPPNRGLQHLLAPGIEKAHSLDCKRAPSRNGRRARRFPPRHPGLGTGAAPGGGGRSSRWRNGHRWDKVFPPCPAGGTEAAKKPYCKDGWPRTQSRSNIGFQSDPEADIGADHRPDCTRSPPRNGHRHRKYRAPPQPGKDWRAHKGAVKHNDRWFHKVRRSLRTFGIQPD